MEKYSLLHIFSALCYFGSLSFFTSYHSVQDFHFPYISSQFSPISVRIAPMESGKKASSKITKKVLTHHGKTPWALNISGRYLCNKYIQSDFCSFNMMKYLEHPSRGFFAFFFFNQLMVFPDFQPDLISAVLFVSKTKWRTSNSQFSSKFSYTEMLLLYCALYPLNKAKH